MYLEMRVAFSRNLSTDLVTAKPTRRHNQQSWLTYSSGTPKYFKSESLLHLAYLKGFFKNDCACLEDAATGRKKWLENRIKIVFPKWENQEKIPHESRAD